MSEYCMIVICMAFGIAGGRSISSFSNFALQGLSAAEASASVDAMQQVNRVVCGQSLHHLFGSAFFPLVAAYNATGMMCKTKGSPVMQRLFFCLSILITGVCLPPASFTMAQEKSELSVADQEVIKWFDEFVEQDLNNVRPLTVLTGWWSRMGNDDPENTVLFAFLLEGDDEQCTVLSLDRQEHHFKRTLDKAPHETVAWSETGIEEFVEQIIESKKVDEDDAFGRRWGARTSEESELVLAATYCVAMQREDLAKRLLETARSMPGWQRRESSFLKHLKRDFANATMWRSVLKFGNVEAGYESIAKGFRLIVEKFPDSKHAKRAASALETLELMIAEQEAHDKTAKPIDELEGDALVEELIYQLRTQNGAQLSQPGSCNIFFDSRGEDSPASRLVDIGFEAVPHLIEAMDDTQFTRSVGYHRDFYFSHHVLRVGDCAQTILSRIAGRRFYGRKYTNGAMIKDGEESSAHKEVIEWWDSVKSKGERQVLIEATEDGSASQAAMLVRKYPLDAIGAIERGIRESADSHSRRQLIYLYDDLIQSGSIGDAELETIYKVLTSVLIKSNYALEKIEAARLLREHDSDLVEDELSKVWNEAQEPGKRSPFGLTNEMHSLGVELLRCESLMAVATVANRFEELSTSTRMDIVNSIPEIGKTAGKEWIDGVEELLVSCLEDTSEVSGMSGYLNGASYVDPRICDAASQALEALLPDRYTNGTGLAGTESRREQTRFEFLNIWRTENGLEAVAVPKPFEIHMAPKSVTQPIIEAIRSADAISLESSIARLVELGPSGLVAARNCLENIEQDSILQTKLQTAISRMANTVTRTEITRDASSIAAPEGWADAIESFQNTNLNSQQLIDFLIRFAEEKPCPGLKVWLTREANDFGVQMKVSFVGESEPRNGSQQMWNKRLRVTLEDDNIHNSRSGTSLEYATEREAYRELERQMKNLCASDQVFYQIAISLVIDK